MTATRLEPARKRHGLNLTFFAAGLATTLANKLRQMWQLALPAARILDTQIKRDSEKSKLTLSKPSKMEFPNSQIQT